MQVTTDWLFPTIAENDATVGTTDWSQLNKLYADDDPLEFGAESVIGYFVAGGDTFSLQYSHLVFNDVVINANNQSSTPDTSPFANVGGSSNKWGETSIAGSQINNSGFGVAIGIGKYDGFTHTYGSKKLLVAKGFEELYDIPDGVVVDGIEIDIDEFLYPGGGGTTGIGIDTIKLRVTYSFDVDINAEASSYGGIFINPPNRKKPYKKFRFKVRSEDGDYLGDWRDVETDPTYKQDINNIIGSMPITFARNDLSIEPIVDILLNEDDEPITNEDDANLLLDLAPRGGLGSGSTLDTNNQVEVDSIYGQFEPLLNEDDTPILNEDGSMILVEDGYPLGRTIFRGYVPRWELPLDGSKITSEIRSYSQDLANIILTTNDSPDIDNSATTEDYYGLAGGGPTDVFYLAQTFTVSGGPKTYSKVRVFPFAGWFTDVPFSISVIGGTPSSPGTNYGSGDGSVNRDFPVPYYDVVFDSPITLADGTYHFNFETEYMKTGGNPTYPINFYKSAAYAGGSVYYNTNDTGLVNDTGSDIAFILYEAGGETTVPFLSKDPSQILRSIVDFARDRGANINYTNDSIEVTGTLVSYTFQTNTVKEAIEKVLELCPSGWYYYYDFGTDTIYLKERSSTPDRWIRKGQTGVNGKIVKTIEQVVNDVLFSGGGDPSLYVREYEAPVAGTRRGLKKLSDNRVTDGATADIITGSEIDLYRNPLYAGDVTITEDGTFYLEDVAVGEVIGFIGYGSLVDAIEVQSVSKDYKPDSMPLTLTYNVPRVNKRVEDIKRNLQVLENKDNPAEPS